MANTEYRRYQPQQRQGLGLSNDPWWIIICIIVAISLAIAGLPWIILGFVAQRYLQRWLHWRLSFALWFVLVFVAANAIYHSYQHGLEPIWDKALTDWFRAILHQQWDILSYPYRQLLPETWPIWLYTWPGIGIAGFVAEVVANRNDTVRDLRQDELRRQRRAQRFQDRARRRTSRPARITDEAGGHMVIGVPIEDDNEVI
jgi:hypothetical protein